MIPSISDERLTELAAKIKPLVRFEEHDGKPEGHSLDGEDGQLFLIKPPADLRSVGFNSCPTATERALGLEVVRELRTYHTTSCAFNPSVAEVLAQIPDELIDEVTHFETIRNWPQPLCEHGDDMYFYATTRLYRAV